MPVICIFPSVGTDESFTRTSLIFYIHPEAAQVSLKRTGDLIHLIMKDNGRGIPAEERTRVFERFYRSPGSHVEGTGLGLSLVRSAWRAHRLGRPCPFAWPRG
jgi:nitrogen fixation/metabolism regulation signal transduction histidine kinase